ncbi:MAG: response regulator [Proteobacteria bacterium]|nr:response regulator [Pseudomonadota bacterium]
MFLNKSTTYQSDLRATIKSALAIFLPLLVLLGGVAGFIYHLDFKREIKVAMEKERQQVELQKNIIASDFNAISSHLMILSELKEYEKLFKEMTIPNRHALAKKFLSVAGQIKLYDQVRFLNAQGLEIIRVNYNNGNPLIVPLNKLQDKAKRYYFIDSFKLDKGGIFVSPFDLNIEGNQIERPFKPMLRFGTPVFDEYGNKRGVLLLNYFGNLLIDKLKNASRNVPGSVMLLNSEGYWLSSKNPEDEWGFMFEDRKNKVFQKSFPRAWAKITNDEFGQFHVTEGLFTHANINPLFQEWQSSSGSGKAYAPSTKRLDPNEYHWKIVSFLPSAILGSKPWSRFKSSLLIYVLILMTLAVGSWFLAKGSVKRRRDQAALRQAEEKFRTIVEGLEKEHFFYLQDTQGNFTYVSPSVTDVLGFTPDELEQSFETILTDNPINEAAKHYGKLALQGEQQPSYEVEVIHNNGGTRILQVTNNPIFDPEGTMIGLGGFAHDFSERKRVEESLKNRVEELADTRLAMLNMMEDLSKAQAKAKEANQAKGDFLANMSHEIRTPMNAVLGMAHLAQKTDLSPKQQDYLNKIQSSANSLLGIINDILDFSKIEAGKLDIESVEFNLDKVLDNLANLITVKASEKEDLEVLFNTAWEVPRFLVGDPLRLGQILINLANNAVKFTESGDIIVSTELASQNEDQVTLKFSVSDTGIGLNEEQIAKLFQSFSQADTSTTRKFGGTGLGLTISKRLTEMMGGKIWVKSEPGQGSTFSFTANFGLGEEKAVKRLAPSPDLHGMKVLVVDDNASSRQILEKILESFSFEVVLAASGEEGLAELENAPKDRPYDLVIVDWKMPGIDGIEAAKRIKHHKDLGKIPPIILITAYARDDIVQQAEQLGLEGFLLKPVSQSVLFDAIMQAMGYEDPKVSRVDQKKEDKTEDLKAIYGARVLLVEDNEINQQVAKEILESAGLNVTVANDGQEAVGAVKKGDFDVVLMDIQMPVMNGYEATRKIREWEDRGQKTEDRRQTTEDREQRTEGRFQASNLQPPTSNLPIIAMTAHAMAGDEQKSIEAGMNDHITKPINPEQLFATLQKWIPPIEDRVHKLPVKSSEVKVALQPGNLSEDELPQSLAGFDLAEGLQRLRGNQKLYKKLLVDFAANYSKAAADIRKRLDDKDLEQAHHLVHNLKGLAGNLAATELLAAAVELEKLIKNGNQKSRPSPIVLEQKFSALDHALNQALASAKSLEAANEDIPMQVALEEMSVLPADLANDIADRMHRYAEMGDVMQLVQISAELKSRSEHYGPISDSIEIMARDFNFEGIFKLSDKLKE